MKILFKLITYTVTLFALTITSISVNAAAPEKITVTDSWLAFDVWEGSGDVSVSIADNWIDTDEIPNATAYSKFESLSMDEKNIDENCFTVADSQNGTVITLKENYLKTFEDGCYHFNADFKNAIVPLNLYIVTKPIAVSDMCFSFDIWKGSGAATAALSPKEYGITLWADLFESLSYKGQVIDGENYSISNFTSTPVIMLKEEYVKTFAPGEYYFTADFKNIKDIMLKLTIPEPYSPGDINGDGKITAQDARLALRASAKLEQLNATQTLAADINNDGNVYANDARSILRISARLESI